MNSRQKNAADIEKRFVSEGKSSAQLLQLAIVCLAIASFFTTAQGMKNYIFHDDAIAYVTSGAIQGILLALSMSLPKYISNIWEKKAFKTGVKALITLVLLVLSAISLFCSSWFSKRTERSCTRPVTMQRHTVHIWSLSWDKKF